MRLPGVARGGRSTIRVTKRRVDRTHTPVRADRWPRIVLGDGFLPARMATSGRDLRPLFQTSNLKRLRRLVAAT